MTDFQKRSTAFLNWFTSQPGSTFHPDLEISDLRERSAGRGIVAKKDIAADTDLFTIPRKSVISVLNSELSQKLPGIFDASEGLSKNGEDVSEDGEGEAEAVDMPRSWLNLILVLIYEYLRGEHSYWKPYLNVLPESEDFDTVMFWTDTELDNLQASAIKAKVGKASADEMFRTKVIPTVKQHEGVFYSDDSPKLSDAELMKLAHRMGSLIMAYAFDLETNVEENEDGEDGWVEDHDSTMSMGMVPMADMLNADAEFNAHLSHGDETLTMTSLRQIKAGEEVLNYYGPLPNGELLRRYGYTSSKHAPYDVVELQWDLIQSVLVGYWQSRGRAEALTMPDVVEESFVLERETGVPDDTGRIRFEARFTTFDEDLVEQINEVNAAAMNIDLERSKLPQSERDALKGAFLEVMAKVLTKRVAEYRTSIEDDEELLKDAATQGRLKNAIDVRLGEKRLLKEASDLVAELRRKHGNTSNGNEEPPAKKQKLDK